MCCLLPPNETFYAFCKRCGIFPSSISSPLRSVILPSATMAQLFFQHRFLNSARPFSPPVGALLLPPNFIAPYPRPTPGTFYILDDPISKICIVNWTLGDATGSYHTTSRTLRDILAEWAPLTHCFHQVRTSQLGLFGSLWHSSHPWEYYVLSSRPACCFTFGSWQLPPRVLLFMCVWPLP